jgi:serine kinase of HPr protein (carbohydrate metabolism regulator)
MPLQLRLFIICLSISKLPKLGVLLQINHIGLYLVGHSGVGKSEIALQLIAEHNAYLICDDAPQLSCTATHQIIGHCPEGFYGLMHLHDLGIVNIRQLYHPDIIKKNQPIDFVIELIATDNRLEVISQQSSEKLLLGNYHYWQYQKNKIPGLRLHLFANRNTPLLIITAIKQFLLSPLR